MGESGARTEQAHCPRGQDTERRIGADNNHIRIIAAPAPQPESPRGDHPYDANGASDAGTRLEPPFPDAMDPDAAPVLVSPKANRLIAAGPVGCAKLNVPTPIT